MFTYVSGANFFGEIVEWSGFALACWSLPSLAFAVFTALNIGPRAIQHHRYMNEFNFCIVELIRFTRSSQLSKPFKQQQENL